MGSGDYNGIAVLLVVKLRCILVQREAPRGMEHCIVAVQWTGKIC